MLVGLLDEAALYDDPQSVFPLLQQARTQVLRVNLYWGGRVGVATRRPASATNPDDPAYDWELYDRTVNYAAPRRLRVLVSGSECSWDGWPRRPSTPTLSRCSRCCSSRARRCGASTCTGAAASGSRQGDRRVQRTRTTRPTTVSSTTGPSTTRRSTGSACCS